MLMLESSADSTCCNRAAPRVIVLVIGMMGEVVLCSARRVGSSEGIEETALSMGSVL